MYDGVHFILVEVLAGIRSLLLLLDYMENHYHCQAFSSSLEVVRHVSGVLGNLTRSIVSTFNGRTSVEWKGGITLVEALKRLAYVDDQVCQQSCSPSHRVTGALTCFW